MVKEIIELRNDTLHVENLDENELEDILHYLCVDCVDRWMPFPLLPGSFPPGTRLSLLPCINYVLYLYLLHIRVYENNLL